MWRASSAHRAAARSAIEVDRDGETLPFTITPAIKEHRDDLGVTVRIGDIGIRHLIPPVVGEVITGMPAAKAGFETGDRIKAIDGKPINSFDDLIDTVGPSAGKKLVFTVERGGSDVTIEVTPEATPQKAADGTMTQRGRIGLAPERPEAVAVSSRRGRPAWRSRDLCQPRARPSPASGTSSRSASRPTRWAAPS